MPAEDRALARRTLLAPTLERTGGTLSFDGVPGAAHPFAAVVLGGVVLRKTYLLDRPAVELLGPGDLLDVRVHADGGARDARIEHEALEHVGLALLDDRFRLGARRWPALNDAVRAQLGRQSRRAAKHLAILQLPRVEDRIVTLLAELADRWGRDTPDGVVLQLPITHELLGQLVGSRRPTVTIALADLAARGAITRPDGRTWLVARP